MFILLSDEPLETVSPLREYFLFDFRLIFLVGIYIIQDLKIQPLYGV